jgi:hypothetical protein
MDISTVVDGGQGVYKITLADGVVLCVPKDPHNVDCVRVQAWVAAGGVIQTS